MTIAQMLAELALQDTSEDSLDYLRALTVTNIAASRGDLGDSHSLIRALGMDAGTPTGIALSASMRIHARTQDDFHPAGRSHIGAVTLAATLGLGDRVGGRTLECLSAGYRVMCALASTYAIDAQRRGYRPSGIFGPIGAAASAGVALNLGVEGIANAIALAAARSAGTNQSWIAGSDEWLLEVGHAARAGVEAALFTEKGVFAAPDAFEGAAGWARAYFEDESASKLRKTIKSPSDWIREVAVKPYPVSGIAQVSTHLACQMHELFRDSSKRVRVRLAKATAEYPGSASTGPFRGRSDALMSVVFCVGAGISDGVVRISRLDHPQELEPIYSRVELIPDTSLAEGFAEIELESASGIERLSASSASILYPSWDEVRGSIDEIAARSEADISVVESIVQALSRDKVDAQALCTLVGVG
jgi:2-methylcitrate dehydratase PrpD